MHKWSNPCTIGKVYRVNDSSWSNWNRVKKGDYAVPLLHSGDSFYDWAIFEPRTCNGDDLYLTLIKLTCGYALHKEAFKTQKPVSIKGLLTMVVRKELQLSINEVVDFDNWNPEHNDRVFRRSNNYCLVENVIKYNCEGGCIYTVGDSAPLTLKQVREFYYPEIV